MIPCASCKASAAAATRSRNWAATALPSMILASAIAVSVQPWLLRRLMQIGEEVCHLVVILEARECHLVAGQAAARVVQIFCQGLVIPDDPRILHRLGVTVALE